MQDERGGHKGPEEPGEALRQGQTRYRSLFENMFEGLAHCRMLFEEGQPKDFIYLEVNRAFEKLTGLKNVVGKRVTEVIPGIRESQPGLFQVYGRVAFTGQSEKLELYLDGLQAWFSVAVYSVERECFTAVFENVTERKQAQEINAHLAAIIESTDDAILTKDLERNHHQLEQRCRADVRLSPR